VVVVSIINGGAWRVVAHIVWRICDLVVVVGVRALGVDGVSALWTHHVHWVSYSGDSGSILVGVVVTPCGWTGIVVMIEVVGPVLGVIVHRDWTCIKMGRSVVRIIFLVVIA
jgi:hypothetical protein